TDSYSQFAGDMLSGGRALLGEDSSVMARMQKKFWKTKQVLIKATGKKEDEYVVASDADLDAKLEVGKDRLKTVFVSLSSGLSQEENELGLFLRFQAEHDRTKAGNMMDATSKALCASAKQRMALCPSLHRLHQEVETFRRRAISDTLLTVTCMEKARTEYRGALLWMKDISQELDPDTYKQLEKFRKVQAQVRGTKSQFEKLKNDVCQKVDMLGASRCNMLSHSLCTYQTTLLQFWEKTAQAMSEIHKAFQGHVPYQFTTLKDLRDPLEQISDSKKQEEKEKDVYWLYDRLISAHQNAITSTPALQNLSGLSRSSDDDLMLMACDMPQPTVPANALHQPQGFGNLEFGLSQLPATGKLVGCLFPLILTSTCFTNLHTGRQPQEDGEPGDMAFLKDLLSPGSGASDEFSKEWQDAFGMFTSPSVPTTSQGAQSGATAARPPSNPPSPTGFLPSQLLDHSLSSTGWATPPMFQAPPLQVPQSPNQSAQPAPKFAAAPGGSKDMSAWFNLFADLDPLSNPDAIGRSADELLNA
uniref:Islet cell autoantigen 1-like n=1 Tax=Neolamprologus brichardi TaxID=32507 RepID=A0A3Q4GHU5_NEOBR